MTANRPAEHWRPVPSTPGYEIDRHRQVRSVERVIIRSNGSPYRVRERLLRPMLHRQSGLWYVKLTVGVRGRCQTLYLSDRLIEHVFGIEDARHESRLRRTDFSAARHQRRKAAS
jgi:hypothetical protein